MFYYEYHYDSFNVWCQPSQWSQWMIRKCYRMQEILFSKILSYGVLSHENDYMIANDLQNEKIVKITSF